MRGVLGLAAAAVAGLAAIVSSQDGSSYYVPLYVGLTFLGAIVSWSVVPPAAGVRRWAGVVAALTWILAAIWGGALLLGIAGMDSRPPPVPDATYVGLPATAYRALGLFGGAILSASRRSSRSAAVKRGIDLGAAPAHHLERARGDQRDDAQHDQREVSSGEQPEDR